MPCGRPTRRWQILTDEPEYVVRLIHTGPNITDITAHIVRDWISERTVITACGQQYNADPDFTAPVAAYGRLDQPPEWKCDRCPWEKYQKHFHCIECDTGWWARAEATACCDAGTIVCTADCALPPVDD